MSKDLVVGLDPGVNTGFSVWDLTGRRLTRVESMRIDEAMLEVLRLHESGRLSHVIFEDARLRRWYGNAGREQLQGAGSIKRDCGIWAEFLGSHGIAYRAVSPQQKGPKLDATLFQRLTKWVGRTNEHARDAAAIVLNARAFVSTAWSS